MNFNKILDDWEKEKKKKNKKIMDKYLDKYLPDTISMQQKKMDQKTDVKGKARAQRLKIKPQRILDLHGMRIEEAFKAVDRFLIECKKDGIKKVLIIHGKGRHSKEPFILAKKIKEYIQKNPLTGEYGIPQKKFGGRGALWILIRS